MRIRKHLSALHLPAVRLPVFTRHEHALISSPPPPVTPTPAVVALEVSGHDPGAAGGKQANTTYRAGRDVVVAVESPWLSLGAATKSVQEVEVTTRLLRTTATGTIVRCFTTPAAMTDSIAHVKRAEGTESQQRDSGPSPPRPTSLPTRPKRTKPNPFLRSCSRQVPPQVPVELVHDCMPQQRRPPEQQDHETVKAGDVSGVRHGVEDVSAERESELQLTDSNETDVEEERSTKRPRRTASTRSLQMLEELNEDFESNRCRRRDGKGWRCRREAQPDYSLCDYHLDKFRATSQRTRSRAKRKPVKARSLMSI